MACSTRCVSSDIGVFVPQPMPIWNDAKREDEPITAEAGAEQERPLHNSDGCCDENNNNKTNNNKHISGIGSEDIDTDNTTNNKDHPCASDHSATHCCKTTTQHELHADGECTDEDCVSSTDDRGKASLNTSHLVEMPEVDEDTCAICLDEFTEDDPAQETECG